MTVRSRYRKAPLGWRIATWICTGICMVMALSSAWMLYVQRDKLSLMSFLFTAYAAWWVNEQRREGSR